MRFDGLAAAAAMVVVLTGCGGGGEPAGGGNEAAPMLNSAAAAEARDSASGAPAVPPCPFRETRDWNASVTGGTLLVNGYVDVMMAGMKPTLTRRPGGSGALGFDLALAPAPGEPVNDFVKLEQSGVGRASRVEIYCGGEKIADVNVVNVG